MGLSRIDQVGLKIEGTEGVGETLLAADFSRNVKETSFGAESTRYERGIKRAAMTKEQDLIGGKLARIGWKEELTGGNVSSDAPWYSTIRAMGFQKTTLKKITIGTVTNGPFKAGDTIGNNATFGSATKTGRVAWTGLVGSDRIIVYEPLAGTFADSDTVYNYATVQASAAVDSTPADAGFSFRPMSDNGSQTPPSATVEYRDADTLMRIIGARGQGSLSLNWGEVPLLDATFRGPRVLQNTDGDSITPALVSGVSAQPAPTMLLGDIGLPFSLGDFDSLVVTQAELRFNQTLTDRRTIGAGGVIAYLDEEARGGYAPTRITDRRVELVIDPEDPNQADFDVLKKWDSNATMRFHAQCGLLVETGQDALCINGPAVSIAQDNYEKGERDGIRSLSLTLLFTGTDDDEVYLDHVYV